MDGVPVGAAGRQGPLLRRVQVCGMPLRSQQCVQQVALWHQPGHLLVKFLDYYAGAVGPWPPPKAPQQPASTVAPAQRRAGSLSR